jgi:23S rRNA (pseudouridine1915-N3)-methyltransferase
MAGLRVVWVGRSGQGFVEQGVAFYRERIAPYAALELIELRAAAHSGREPAQALRREGEAILKRLGPEDPVALLDERGRQLSTRELAAWLAARQSASSRPLTFVVGGAYGVDESVRRRADETIALSRLTLPHQLVRVVLLEQLYRVLSLQAGHGYHHD